MVYAMIAEYFGMKFNLEEPGPTTGTLMTFTADRGDGKTVVLTCQYDESDGSWAVIEEVAV